MKLKGREGEIMADSKPRCLMSAEEIFEANRAKKNKNSINIGVDVAHGDSLVALQFHDNLNRAINATNVVFYSPRRCGRTALEAKLRQLQREENLHRLTNCVDPFMGLFGASICEPSRPMRKHVTSTIVRPKQLTEGTTDTK